ncbi:MAG: heavy-metal-associated domain-containing protein [Acholeplasmatales bacterium]|nr:heavy-metal-associated domain-containing protein [Acholeplasmatales bacterium]
MYKITLGIDGMKCGMCEAHVNDYIRKNFNVKKVKSSHIKKETVILSQENIDEEDIKKVLSSTGYNIISYKTENYEKKSLFSFKK